MTQNKKIPKQPVKYNIIPDNPSEGLKELLIDTWVLSGSVRSIGNTKFTQLELSKALGYSEDEYETKFLKLLKEARIRAKIPV